MCNETRAIEALGLRLTHFGWIVSGAAPRPSDELFCGLMINEINQNLQQFWQIEEPVSAETKKPESNECVAHFEKNVRLTEKKNLKFVYLSK